MKRHIVCQSVGVACAVLVVAAASGENPFASEVVSYDPGDPVPGFDDPTVALGTPTRFTGVGIFPAVVSGFNPPWSDTDIVSIGPGGQLTVQFDSPVVDDPNNPFGIDLLIFGNTGFVDVSFPQGVVGGLFGDDGGVVEVSADGDVWFTVPGVKADGLFPTQGYLDSGAYDTKPGTEPTDFTKPVDPSLTLDDLLGLSHDQVLELYDGSGGGAGIDIASVGLTEITYVRVSNPGGATVDIDGFARVAPVLVGDLNGDGVVNISDLLLLLSAWGPAQPGGIPADLNDDGVVDVADLLILLANWG